MHMAFLELDQYNPTKIRQYKKVRWFGDISKIVCIFFEVMDYDISDVCNWQNTEIINIDDESNKMTLEKQKKCTLKICKYDKLHLESI